MRCFRAVGVDAGTQAAEVIAGFVAAEAETAKVGKMWKVVAAAAVAVVAAAAAVATSVTTATVAVGLRCFAAKFETFVIVVVPFATCFVAITVTKIAATDSVAAAAVRDRLVVGLFVAGIASLVVRMSLSIHSCQLIGNFVGIGYFLRVTVAEAESSLLVAVRTDSESGQNQLCRYSQSYFEAVGVVAAVEAAADSVESVEAVAAVAAADFVVQPAAVASAAVVAAAAGLTALATTTASSAAVAETTRPGAVAID